MTDLSFSGCRSPSTEVPSSQLSSAERLTEIAEILARGLQRLSARQSTPKSADFGESSLDISNGRSVDPEDSASEDAR